MQRPRRPERAYDHLRLGAHGEDLAARHYVESGFEVLARNWRCTAGEIDLVVRCGDLVVFAEVKTRSNARFGSPAEAVDHRRVRRLRAATAEYLRVERPEGVRDVRLDVVAVVGVQVEVIEGAC